MPTWLKVLLVIGVVVFGLVSTAFTIGFFWFRAHSKELRREAARTSNEAQEFARGKEINACVDEGLRRAANCSPTSFICMAQAQVFVRQCAQAATVPPHFCDDVPKPTDIMATVKWQQAECARRGRANDSRCPQVVGALQTYCSRQ